MRSARLLMRSICSLRIQTSVGYIYVTAINPRRGPLPQREMRQRNRKPSYSVRCLLLSPAAMRSNPGMSKKTQGRRIARSCLVGWRWTKIFLYFLSNPLACVVTHARTNARCLAVRLACLNMIHLTHLSVLLRQLSLTSAPLTSQNETHQRSDTGAQKGSCRNRLRSCWRW